MKKTIFLILFFLFAFSLNVNAEENTSENEMYNATGDYLEKSITDEANDFFEDNDITMSDPKAFTEISIKAAFKYIFSELKSSMAQPVRLLGMLIAVVMLIAIAQGMGTQTGGAVKTVDMVGVLVCVKVMFDSIASCIELTFNTIKVGSDFMLTYVPVFAGVIGASGNVTSAAAYNLGVLLFAEAAAQISVKILIPALSAYLAFAILEAVNPELAFSGFAEGIKKAVQWTLGIVMTVFVGMITIQGIVGASSDTVVIKAAKFAASSFIPVIGSAMSDAYSTVRGSLGLLRSGVGTFGIIILILTVLPSLISIVAMKISVSIASFVSEIAGTKKITVLLKNVSSVLSILMSILLCFLLMLIISTTVMMLIGLNM